MSCLNFSHLIKMPSYIYFPLVLLHLIIALLHFPEKDLSDLCHGQGGLAGATAEVEEPVLGPQGGVHGGEVRHGGGVDYVVSLPEVYRGADDFAEYF